jgi:hypothetical protein
VDNLSSRRKVIAWNERPEEKWARQAFKPSEEEALMIVKAIAKITRLPDTELNHSSLIIF